MIFYKKNNREFMKKLLYKIINLVDGRNRRFDIFEMIV